jgi:hypothetical protein
LYSTLDSDEFLKQLDKHYIDMTIFEVSSKKKARERIYKWFKEWVVTLDDNVVERLLKFITGTTRVPLPMKMKVCKYFIKNFQKKSYKLINIKFRFNGGLRQKIMEYQMFTANCLLLEPVRIP